MLVFYHLAPGPWLSILLAIGTSSILIFIQQLDALYFRSTRKDMLEKQQAWQSSVFDPAKLTLGQWFMGFDVAQKSYEWCVTMQTTHRPNHVPWVVPPDAEWDQLVLGLTNRCSAFMQDLRPLDALVVANPGIVTRVWIATQRAVLLAAEQEYHHYGILAAPVAYFASSNSVPTTDTAMSAASYKSRSITHYTDPNAPSMPVPRAAANAVTDVRNNRNAFSDVRASTRLSIPRAERNRNRNVGDTSYKRKPSPASPRPSNKRRSRGGTSRITHLAGLPPRKTLGTRPTPTPLISGLLGAVSAGVSCLT
jgi:hypothetical protein